MLLNYYWTIKHYIFNSFCFFSFKRTSFRLITVCLRKLIKWTNSNIISLEYEVCWCELAQVILQNHFLLKWIKTCESRAVKLNFSAVISFRILRLHFLHALQNINLHCDRFQPYFELVRNFKGIQKPIVILIKVTKTYCQFLLFVHYLLTDI